MSDVDALAMMVPTRLLRCEWPPNDGVMPGDPRFDVLMTSVLAEGVREPLAIRLDWLIIDGNHRLAVARMLGIEWLPVRIWTGVEWVPSAPSRHSNDPDYECAVEAARAALAAQPKEDA